MAQYFETFSILRLPSVSEEQHSDRRLGNGVIMAQEGHSEKRDCIWNMCPWAGRVRLLRFLVSICDCGPGRLVHYHHFFVSLLFPVPRDFRSDTPPFFVT